MAYILLVTENIPLNALIVVPACRSNSEDATREVYFWASTMLVQLVLYLCMDDDLKRSFHTGVC